MYKKLITESIIWLSYCSSVVYIDNLLISFYSLKVGGIRNSCTQWSLKGSFPDRREFELL